ncbi:hypothetical protein VTO42DRAFT_3221 [Malbranchea cinnamomea]
MSTSLKGLAGSGANAPKRGTAVRGRAIRGGFNPLARPDGSTRGRESVPGARGGRGKGSSFPSSAHDSLRAKSGGVPEDVAKGTANRLERPASAAGPLRGILTKTLPGDRKSKSTSPLPNNIDRSRDPRRQNRTASAMSVDTKDYSARYEQLKQDRAKERTQAIASGQMTDPNQPTSLNRAITPTGTCTDMCPEFERVERIVQKMVDKCEKLHDPETASYQVVEAKMIKRFRRSAAGYDEQLPSDIRTPKTLLQTMNYMLRHVITDDESLGSIHKFVWDRTRSIRNDLSIQQLTQVTDVEVAVKCLERIARFHIVSLHLLSSRDNAEHFDHHQEREQLNNTLLSLLYYYDDNRGRINFPNEDEFRAYYIVFAIHDQRPDLEARVQKWPRELRQSPRVQVALELFAAATNTWEYQGTLDSKRPNAIAQGFYSRFFNIVRSDRVSYLMACIAEIYFNQVRQTAIRSIWKAYCRQPLSQQHKNQEWTVEELTKVLCFDDAEQTIAFCEKQGLQLTTNPEGHTYLNWADRSIDSVDFQPSSEQVFSDKLVESKRRGRSLVALILGMNVAQAIKHGMINTSLFASEAVSEGFGKDESLFVSDDEEPDRASAPTEGSTLFGPALEAGMTENPSGALQQQQSTTEQPKNIFCPQSGSRLSATAPPFTPPTSLISSATPAVTSTPFVSPFQTGSSVSAPGASAFNASQTKSPFPAVSSTPSSSPFAPTDRPTFSSIFGSTSGAPNTAPTSNSSKAQSTFSSLSQPVSNPFLLSTATFGKSDSSPQLGQTPSFFSFGAPTNVNPFGKGKDESIGQPASQSHTNSKPLVNNNVGTPTPGKLFQSFPSSAFGQPSMFGQAKSGSLNETIPVSLEEPSRSTTPPGLPTFSFTGPPKPLNSQNFQAPLSNKSTFNWSGGTSSQPLEESKQSEILGATAEVTDDSKKAEQEARERVKQQLERKREIEKLEAERKEAEKREAERREAEKEIERREAARKEAERLEAEREAERKEAAAQEAARKEKEKRAREMAKRIAAEVKAGQRDIARLKESERTTQEREARMKQAIEQEILSKRKALFDEEEASMSSKGKSKAQRVSDEGPLTVEELLGDLEGPASWKPPPKPEPPAKPLVDEDELLLNTARMVAHQLSQGRLFDWTPTTDLGASISSTRSMSPSSGPSRPRSLSSTFEGDRAIVNGYEVALAPSTPGLGRSLSRTEQRIRLTGAKGLAYKPVTPLRRSTGAKESNPKSKRFTRDTYPEPL